MTNAMYSSGGSRQVRLTYDYPIEPLRFSLFWPPQTILNPTPRFADIRDMGYKSDLRQVLIAVFGLALSALVIGCNGAPTKSSNEDKYRVDGLVVQNLNVDTAFIAARFARNDTSITNASIKLAGTPLGYFASLRGILAAYQSWLKPADSLAGSSVYLRVADASRFTDSLPLGIVGTFGLTDNFQPPNHHLQGMTNYVSLEWTAAANADSYVLAAVKTSLVGTGAGYSAQVTATGVAGTIPADAFMNPSTNLPDTGLYNIYVYAFNDAPDSALATKLLPVPWPIQVTENIARTSLKGRFGSITVALKDTVRVLAQ